MIKIGITGRSGFVGTHLANRINLLPEKFVEIPFYDNYFQEQDKLDKFVSSCDAIVHLAAMNRHNDPELIYSTNIDLVNILTEACTRTSSTPHILFASSTQEELDNPYGRSKLEGRRLFEKWAESSGAHFSAFIIPNVFGPFGDPYYNSVVATFCYQIAHGEVPKILQDNEIKLIYIDKLLNVILEEIASKRTSGGMVRKINVSHSYMISVSELLAKLNSYKDQYFNFGTIPDLDNNFERDLFNTFITYIDHKEFFPFLLSVKTDDRGCFVETVKASGGGQFSFSVTRPGITRGNHFHTRKAERFAVIRGKAVIELRRIGTKTKFVFQLDGNMPSFVDMPIWYTHNITNTGEEDLYTLFWISEHFDPSDPDTYFEQV